MSFEQLPPRERIAAAARAGEYVHPEDAAWLPRRVEGWGERHTARGLLSSDELDAMEWGQVLERRAAQHVVNPDARDAMEWGDLAGACEAFGYRGPVPDLAPARSGGAGLVSVLSTQNKRLPTSFAQLAATGRLAEALSAFPLDPDGRRIQNLRMQVGVAARLQCAKLDAATFDCLMVTLTYAGTNADWRPSHVRAFMDHVRKWCARRGHGCHYVWVAELQKRGVVHYHVALWMPKGVKLPKPDEQGWWPHGMTRIEVARAAVPYLLKYLSKGSTPCGGRLPHGARMYGMGGLDHVERRTRRWLGLPAFVRARSDVLDKWTRADGGGWRSPSGEHFHSEFSLVVVGTVRCLMRVHQHSADWRPDGPFTWLHRRPSP